MGTENFYSDLSIFDDFSVVTNLSNYNSIPSDWFIVAADVQDSTGAIKNGQYKAVNIIGVSVITAVRNACKPLLLPYIFGGDGATLCIPPSVVTQVSEALVATRVMAEEQFDLKLRVGIIPVKYVLNEGYKVLIARHRMSKFYIQTAFAGGGVEYAEELIKDDEKGKQYRLEKDLPNSVADFSGLECRWDNVYSQQGETIALIVKAILPSIEEQSTFYNEIIQKIREIYGDDELCSPVQLESLRLTKNTNKLSYEVKIKTFLQSKINIIKYWIILKIQTFFGKLLMSKKVRFGGVDWGDYKKDLIKNTDFKKFDGVLREVISGTEEKRELLEKYLHQRFLNKECVYGIHASDSALVTCLINNRSGEHFHFVDGADGGYAMAASKMKSQIRELH